MTGPGPYPGTPPPGPPYLGHYAAPHPGSGYGPPQASHPWGPPPQPARRRRGRRALVAVLVLLVVAGLVVLALLAFVTGPRFARVDVLDAAAVERGVTEVVTQDWRRSVSAVDCPEGVRARAGESFRCSATVDGRPRQVPVDVLDDRGTYQVGQPR